MVTAPVPPAGLRPAQLGLLLVGHPTLGHVAGTLLDIARRPVAELTDVERTLVDGLPPDALAGGALADVLDRFRHALVADAVHRGLFHRLHHDRRTAAGEDLLAAARAFRATVRAGRHDEDLVAYAVAFGVTSPAEVVGGERAAAVVAAARELPDWQPVQPAKTPLDGVFLPQSDDRLGTSTIAAGLTLGPFGI